MLDPRMCLTENNKYFDRVSYALDRQQLRVSLAPDSQRLADPVNHTFASSKAPIIRGARACTVCRQAKVYFTNCVGMEHHLHYNPDEMCRLGKWHKAMSAMQTRECGVSINI